MNSLIKNLFRLISFFLTFQIIILLPKVWVTDSLGVAAAEQIQTLQKQVGKRVEFDVDKNLSSQIAIPMNRECETSLIRVNNDSVRHRRAVYVQL